MNGTRSSELRCASSEGKRVIASSPVVTIEACGCGVVHLHFGPMSLRFTACSIDALYRALGDARAHLAADEDAVPTVSHGVPRGLA